MKYPDRTQVAVIRRDAEDALASSRELIVRDRERIATIFEMCDAILQLSTETEPLKLELIKGIGRGTVRALRARGVNNLVDLARLDPDTIKEFCLVEGVIPRGYEAWPQMALALIQEIDADRIAEVNETP